MQRLQACTSLVHELWLWLLFGFCVLLSLRNECSEQSQLGSRFFVLFASCGFVGGFRHYCFLDLAFCFRCGMSITSGAYSVCGFSVCLQFFILLASFALGRILGLGLVAWVFADRAEPNQFASFRFIYEFWVSSGCLVALLLQIFYDKFLDHFTFLLLCSITNNRFVINLWPNRWIGYSWVRSGRVIVD